MLKKILIIYMLLMAINLSYFTVVTGDKELNDTINHGVDRSHKEEGSTPKKIIKPITDGSNGKRDISNQSKVIYKYSTSVKKTSDKDLPQELRWEEFEIEKMKNFLKSVNSILVEEHYLIPLVEICKSKDLNAILLIAITGQEQSFVPRNNGNAKRVANNPFNVYHSWIEYNTNIKDSTLIACNTIIHLSKNRPQNIHPIQWINRKYAEDQKWWKGVDKYFQKIRRYVL